MDVTIDKAIEELNIRMGLWSDYGRRTAADKAAREWLTVLRMSRDALVEKKYNADMKAKVFSNLGRLDPGSMVTLDVVREVVESFRIGDDANDPAGS